MMNNALKYMQLINNINIMILVLSIDNYEKIAQYLGDINFI